MVHLRPLGAAAICIATVFVSDSASAQILHRYSFDGTGTMAVDSVGTADGFLMAGAALTGTGEVALDGVAAYVNLPLGLLTGLDEATFEAWYEWGSTSMTPWTRIMDIGSNSVGSGSQGIGETYLVLTPMSGDAQMQHAGVVKTNPNGSSLKVYSGQAPSAGGLTHLAWTYDSNADSMSLYINGALGSTVSVMENLSDVIEQNNWLGRSQFSTDGYFDGTISEFRIYGGALTGAEVAASFAAGPDAGVSNTIGSTFCSAANNSTGVPGEIAAMGQAAAAANHLTLLTSSLPTNQFGIFIVSMDQGFVPGPGSNGNLCLAGVIGRINRPGQILSTGATGGFQLALDITMIPQGNGFVSVMAGEAWSFQAWHRDSVGMGSNFTNGVEISFL